MNSLSLSFCVHNEGHLGQSKEHKVQFSTCCPHGPYSVVHWGSQGQVPGVRPHEGQCALKVLPRKTPWDFSDLDYRRNLSPTQTLYSWERRPEERSA